MEKRTLLAIVLSMAILFVWGIVFDQTKIKGTPQPKQKTVTVTPSQPAKPMDVASPAATPQSNIKSASSVVVETPLYTATFTTKGAELVSLKLKKYLTTMDKDAKPVELLKAPMPTLLLNGGFSDAGLMYESSQQGTITSSDTPLAIEFRTEASPGITLKKIFP